MKTKNIISGLICSLFVISGQQSYANTVHSNQSNSTVSGLHYVKTDVVKLAKQTTKDVKKDNNIVKNEDKDKKDEVKEVKEETKKDEVKEVKEEVKKDEVKEVKEETKKDEVKKVKEEAKNDEKDKDDDGTNPLSFENLVSHEQSDNNHCKSKKSNKCNDDDHEDEDEDGHHNGDDDDNEHEISPVPIPGAIWLFGTALMGFISMSSRRKV